MTNRRVRRQIQFVTAHGVCLLLRAARHCDGPPLGFVRKLTNRVFGIPPRKLVIRLATITIGRNDIGLIEQTAFSKIGCFVPRVHKLVGDTNR